MFQVNKTTLSDCLKLSWEKVQLCSLEVINDNGNHTQNSNTYGKRNLPSDCLKLSWQKVQPLLPCGNHLVCKALKKTATHAK